MDVGRLPGNTSCLPVAKGLGTPDATNGRDMDAWEGRLLPGASSVCTYLLQCLFLFLLHLHASYESFLSNSIIWGLSAFMDYGTNGLGTILRYHEAMTFSMMKRCPPHYHRFR